MPLLVERAGDEKVADIRGLDGHGAGILADGFVEIATLLCDQSEPNYRHGFVRREIACRLETLRGLRQVIELAVNRAHIGISVGAKNGLGRMLGYDLIVLDGRRKIPRACS